MNPTIAQQIAANTGPVPVHTLAVAAHIYKRDKPEGMVYFFSDGSMLTFELTYTLKRSEPMVEYGEKTSEQQLEFNRGQDAFHGAAELAKAFGVIKVGGR